MMKHLWTRFWGDEAGFILSAELILIATVVVLGLTVCMVSVRNSVAAEMTDLASAFRQLDQSYGLGGLRGCQLMAGWSSWTAGSRFLDETLREPGSEQDIIVEDRIVGTHRLAVIDSDSVAITPLKSPAPLSSQPGCPAPCSTVPNYSTPGGVAGAFPLQGSLEVPRQSFSVVPMPLAGPDIPCADCPLQSRFSEPFSPRLEGPPVLPTPSSDLPPRTRPMWNQWAFPGAPPIPKMPAGPLQVW